MASKRPSLSVIIPCFNDGRFLAAAVESARSNQRGQHEIIVVNDGSSDPDTLQTLQKFCQGGIQIIDQANAGLGAARNRGIAAASGHYILPLDSDNLIRPQYIDRGIEILDRKPSIDVVYGDAEFTGARTGRWRVQPFSLARLLQSNYIDACAVYRKSAWERCGGYDDKMPVQGHEDWDLWIRIACSGGGFHHVDEVLFDYHVRAGSMTANMHKPANLAVLRKYIYDKNVEVSVGELARWQHSWDAVVDDLYHHPAKGLMSLVVRAFYPHLHARFTRWRDEN